MNFTDQFADAVRRLDPLSSGDSRWLIAFSGGPDSAALLVAAVGLGIKVVAAHINHHLRGDESEADEEFCRSLCQKLQVPIIVDHLNPSASDENSLRDSRYAALISTAQRQLCSFIATGHTLDDQCETILFRIFRGTSPTGLKGIPACRAVTPSISIVRPLLNIRRTEILDYLRLQNCAYRLDSSNFSSAYTRNFIRNELIPMINERFGDITPRLETLRLLLTDDEYVLDELSETRAAAMFAGAGNCPLTALLGEPIALQRRVVASALRSRGIEVTSDRVCKILELAGQGGTLNLSEDWQAVVQHGRVGFVENESSVDAGTGTDSAFESELNLQGLTLVPELGVAIRTVAAFQAPEEFPLATADEVVVDLSCISQPLIARRRRAGDTIVPFGMAEPVRLKRYLQTHRKADGRHAGHPLVIAQGTDVLWVPGVGVSNKVRVGGQPTHKLSVFPLATDEFPIA